MSVPALQVWHPALCSPPRQGRMALLLLEAATEAEMPHSRTGRSEKSEECERGGLEAPWLSPPLLPDSYPLILELQKAVVCRELQLWQGQPENMLEQGGLVRKQIPTLTTAAAALLRLPAFPWQARQREHREHSPPSPHS